MQSNAANFHSPTIHEGFRFAKMGSVEHGVVKDTKRWSSITMSTTSLDWGYGSHKLPGRFFTARKLKLILEKSLLGYDLS